MINRKIKIILPLLLPITFLTSCNHLNKGELPTKVHNNKLNEKYNFNLKIKGTDYLIHDGDTIELKNDAVNKLKTLAPQWNKNGLIRQLIIFRQFLNLVTRIIYQ